jgi:hypothetical protein
LFFGGAAERVQFAFAAPPKNKKGDWASWRYKQATPTEFRAAL